MRPDGIQHNISTQLEQVRFFFNQYRLKAPLKNMPDLARVPEGTF
jgi:hypothetical protein